MEPPLLKFNSERDTAWKRLAEFYRLLILASRGRSVNGRPESPAIPQLPQGNGEGRRPGGTRDSHRGLIRAPALGFWEPEGGDVWYEAALLGLADTAPGASVRLRRPHAVGQ